MIQSAEYITVSRRKEFIKQAARACVLRFYRDIECQFTLNWTPMHGYISKCINAYYIAALARDLSSLSIQAIIEDMQFNYELN